MATLRPRVRYYPRSDGKWEWQFLARNGRRMFGSEPQGYNSLTDARRAWRSARRAVHAVGRIDEVVEKDAGP